MTTYRNNNDSYREILIYRGDIAIYLNRL